MYATDEESVIFNYSSLILLAAHNTANMCGSVVCLCIAQHAFAHSIYRTCMHTLFHKQSSDSTAVADSSAHDIAAAAATTDSSTSVSSATATSDKATATTTADTAATANANVIEDTWSTWNRLRIMCEHLSW
jgi:hypothetical protein